MKNLGKANEKELREAEDFWPKTEKELMKYINTLTNRGHEYGTCVYAMSLSAVAAFHFVAHKLGVTGFQASCADLDILRRTRSLKAGFRIIDYEKLLFPQYLNSEHFPSMEEMVEDNKKQLIKLAKEKLKDCKGAHPEVVARWKYIASLEGK